MSQVQFDRSGHQIRLTGAAGDILAGPFDAYNNVDSHSSGIWPDGTYSYVDYHAHPALSDPDSEYGAHGILIFSVPGRSGMGVHSGRRSIPDGLGRTGPAHCTLGCIRTTDDAIAAFLQVSASDAIQSISVGVAFAVEEAAVTKALPSAPPVKRRPKPRAKAPKRQGVPKKARKKARSKKRQQRGR